MSDPRPEHVRIPEGIGLPINRPIYQLGRPIVGRFRPVFTRCRQFLDRSTRRRAPPNSRSNLAAFHPAIVVFFGRLPALAPYPVYRLNRRLPPDSDRFLSRRR
jgi:hypothetical protein